MDLGAAFDYLDRHINLEATAGRVEGLSLERMGTLVAAMGDPQRDYPVIHVTGTNGKGSTARMATSLLVASGLSVGTYLSPHLERVNERLRWDGEPVDDETLAALIGDVALFEDAAGVQPSWFEIVTAAAFRWFADVAVDVAVVEVGLLGRWDATNVADGSVAVVTNVGRDHTDFASGWRRTVATEKAGIVKEGATLVLGATPAREVVLRGRDFDCHDNHAAVGGRVIDLETLHGSVENVFLPLHGAHQGDNAAVALASTEAFFGRGLDADLVAEGLGGIELPGRFEVVGRQPLIVLDGAHNPDGAAAATATLADDFLVSGSRVLVLGFLSGRDPAAMAAGFEVGPGDTVIACAPKSPRAIPAEEVAAIAAERGADTAVVPDVAAALGRARDVAGPDDAILVAGSLYAVGAARAALGSSQKAVP